MIRNLKLVGTVLAAMVALSAIAASSAMAGSVTAAGPVTLVGSQTGAESENSISVFGLETRCPTATYTGHKIGAENELISSGATSVTVTPHYGACSTAGFPSTIDMNGCDYTLQLEQTTEQDRYFTRTTIVCPSNKHITITIFGSAAKHLENSPFCHITITENILGAAGPATTTTTNGHLDLTGSASIGTSDKKSPSGSILCPEETSLSTLFRLDITFAGRNGAGGGTFVSLSD